MKMSFIGILLLVAMPVFGFEYHGDGNFTDSGMLSAFDRYQLVLPPVNLCEAGQYSFSIGELPAEALFLKMEYIYPKVLGKDEAYRISDLISSVVVQLTLEDMEMNAVIFKHEGKLYESGYDESGKYWRRGLPSVVENLYGKIVFRVDDVDFRKGFFWQHHSAKKLTFKVIAPLPSLSNCLANFVIRGGGWK